MIAYNPKKGNWGFGASFIPSFMSQSLTSTNTSLTYRKLDQNITNMELRLFAQYSVLDFKKVKIYFSPYVSIGQTQGSETFYSSSSQTKYSYSGIGYGVGAHAGAKLYFYNSWHLVGQAGYSCFATKSFTTNYSDNQTTIPLNSAYKPYGEFTYLAQGLEIMGGLGVHF
jgi:hypothetical protein